MLFCQDVEVMLQDYLDGYLLASQRELLEAHVARCGPCRALLASMARMDARLERLEQVEAPPHLSGAILGALPPAYAPAPLRRVLAWGAAPVLALLLAGFGFLLRGRQPAPVALVSEREVDVVFVAPQAMSVAVVGDFNGWDPQRTRMARAEQPGVWRARLRLAPGTYQYSFVIDGSTWTLDPRAGTALADGFGGANSVMVVDG